MSRLEMILTAILTFSMVLNIGLIIYVRGAIIRLLSVSEELGDLQQMINSFAIHLKNVYELEMFYGDETLAALLEHAVSFNEYLGTFEQIYSLTEAKEALQEGKELDEEEPEETDE
jgi:hypothetical protein|tara:strand:+ start:1396 stop:1743 length:348 start_codon:yes stop_codon:yes gene_type:complete